MKHAQAGDNDLLSPSYSFWSALALIILLTSVCACSSPKKPPAERPVPVLVAAAQQKDVPVVLAALGTVEAAQTVSVRSQIDGLIKKVYFSEGQDVKKGDLLLDMDCRSQEAALRQAEANLSKDRAQANNAREDLKRYALLIEKNYVAREQYDQVRTNLAALEATLKADQAIVDNMRVERQYCRILAPINGRTGILKVNQGNIIKSTETEIVTINQIQPVNVVLSIPDRDLPRIKHAMLTGTLDVEASIPGETQPEDGAITFMDNAIDKTTGTITLKGSFPNREKRLLPGQFVDVKISLSTLPAAVLVPTRSVEQGQNGPFVYVVHQNSTVEARPVTLGPSMGNDTVISKGLMRGEQVVTDGQLKLKPGAAVRIKDKA